MKKITLLLFAVLIAINFNSCSKDEATPEVNPIETSNYTGYYNSKTSYNNDLLLRIVSPEGTCSFFGTTTGSNLNVTANLYINKKTGLKTITRINKTKDSIHVYELDKPELGGLLYVIKDNKVAVYQFEFVDAENKISATFHYITLPISAGKSILLKTNETGAEGIDESVEKFYAFTQTLGLSEVLNSIKESVSEAKDNAIKNYESFQKSRTELSNYLKNLVNKNPEPIKKPLDESTKNPDEQKVIEEVAEVPYDCSKTTLGMTLDVIGNSVTAEALGGDGNFSYEWSNGVTGPHAIFKIPGTYTVTVTDGHGCTHSMTTTISDCVDDYPKITIGTQTWMQKNLDVEHYRNGDPIPQVTDPAVWATLTTGAWCYYNNDPANGAIYGKLYNLYAVKDIRGLAPKCYHVATSVEWNTLIDSQKGDSSNLKEAGNIHWIKVPYDSPNDTNTSGFTALPGGMLQDFGFGGIGGAGYDANYEFTGIGGIGRWWGAPGGYYRSINSIRMLNDTTYISEFTSEDYRAGYSVRCVKD